MPGLGSFEVGLLGSFLWLSLLPFILLGLAIPYAVLRARDSREHPDSQLGLKVGLHYFLSVGILQLLSGLTVISVDLLTREDARGVRDERGRQIRPAEAEERNEAIRTGIAIAAAGAAFAFLHMLLLTGTDDRRNPIARRTFAGWRFAIHGLVVLFAITACLVIVVQKDFSWRTVRGFLGVLLVWFPSWIIHLILLWVRSIGFSPTRPVREEI